jgi:hypothetical protein
MHPSEPLGPANVGGIQDAMPYTEPMISDRCLLHPPPGCSSEAGLQRLRLCPEAEAKGALTAIAFWRLHRLHDDASQYIYGTLGIKMVINIQASCASNSKAGVWRRTQVAPALLVHSGSAGTLARKAL